MLTLNVHDPDDRKLPDLADFLDESGAELIALTECRRRSAEALAERLGCVGFAHAHAPYWGNALLTRTLGVDAAPAIDLPPSRLGEARSAAVGAVHGSGWAAPFVVTHLDYGPENVRREQMRHLLDALPRAGHECVLMGDLNALARTDYDEARWARIAAARARANLSPPTSELIDWLRDELGFVDAQHDSDAFAPTCRYGTRVDYVLVGGRCQLQPVARSYRVLGAMERGLSDHDAVSVELAIAPAA